ncbi:hypothetical protein [Clostridium tyrobutyricum]|nr:hypothetical protein [Clostridium tyrobutyricum]MBV4423665.1 hypothetical protein [Clostridium tyrobutyricum]
MSRLYNYFVICWTINTNFTIINLNNAVTKGYITANEGTQIEAMPKAL